MYCITGSSPGSKIKEKDYDSAPRAELVTVSQWGPFLLEEGGKKWFRQSNWGIDIFHLRVHRVE